MPSNKDLEHQSYKLVWWGLAALGVFLLVRDLVF